MYNLQVKKLHLSKCTRTLLMILPVCVIGFIPMKGFGQNIDEKGMFKPRNSNLFYNKNGIVKPPKSFSTASLDDIKNYKKELLIRVNAAIYNLEDDSLCLQRQYDVLWTTTFAPAYGTELAALKVYLEKGTINKTLSYRYVPDPNDIEAFVKLPIYSVDKNVLSKPDYDEHHVLKHDLLSEYILNRFNNSYGNDATLKNLVMDMSYIRGWREIESWAVMAIKVKASAEAMRDKVFSIDSVEIEELRHQLNAINVSNSLTTWVNNSDFIKKWLWFTASQPGVNPFYATSADRKYPDKEKYTFMSPEKRAAEAELDKQDLLKKYQQTKKVYNQILLPVKLDSQKVNQVVKLHEFDISVKPVSVKYPNEMLDDDEKLKVVMYNIPASKDVVLTQGFEALKYPGKIMSDLDSVAKIVGVLTALGTNNISTITALTGRLNPDKTNPVKYNSAGFENNPNPSKILPLTLMNTVVMGLWENATTISSLDSVSKRLNSFPKPAVYALINGRYVPLTKKDLIEDKRRILYTSKAFTANGEFHPIQYTDKELIENFILIDVGFLDYRDNTVFDKNAEQMIERFKTYEERIKKMLIQLNSLINDAIAKYDSITPYLRFINRNLPPDSLKPAEDKDPVYLTKIVDINVPEAPKKINLSITMTDPKTKETDDLVKETVKVIRTIRIDVSAGIAYTFNPYDIASQEGSGLPTSKRGDLTQFVAGFHIYFWKPLNRLHVTPFRHADEKISLYLGLTLKNALDHYFAGLSYDLVPGARLIGGLHFYNNPRFEIVNNAVAKKASGLTNAGGFMALNIQAATLGKLIGLFK